MDTTTSLPVDVSSMLLDANGSVITGRILTTSTYPQQADIVYNPVRDEYFVVFVRSYSQATTGNDIYGLRVHADNYVIDPPGAILIANETINENNPAIATNGKFSYGVVWERLVNMKNDIIGTRLDFNGISAWHTYYFLSYSNEDNINPAVTNFGDGYLTTWQTTEINGTTLSAAIWDLQNIAQYVVSPAGFWDNQNSAVAAGNHNFLIAYEGDLTGDPTIYRHIYARLLATYNRVYIPIIIRNP